MPAFDLLCGTDQVRKGIDAGWPLDKLMTGFQEQLEAFLPTRKRYLIYD